MKYVDRDGREKVLILVGKNIKSDDDFGVSVEYQIQKYLKQWIKRKNIIIKKDILSPDDFNNAVQPHKGNISEMIYLTHWSQTSLWWWLINKDNVSQLKSITDSKNPVSKLTLIACNAGWWDSPIAQDISNALGVKVEAADNYVLPTTNPEWREGSSNPMDTMASYLVYWLMRISHEDWEPTLLLWIGEWNIFTPSY